MKIKDSDLLSGERLIVSKPANAVIRLDEYGLSRFPADQAWPELARVRALLG